MCVTDWLGWCRLVLLLSAPAVCTAQFGGGYGDYTPPAPICKPFTCPKGEKPAGNGDHQIWSYGCKDSGLNVLSMADLNNPMGGMNKGKNVDKCCIERDICKQTCGTTSQECHNNFQACSKKTCKGDQNCNLAAMMSDIRSDPFEEEEKPGKKDPPEEYNWEKEKQKQKDYDALTGVTKKWSDGYFINYKAFVTALAFTGDSTNTYGNFATK